MAVPPERLEESLPGEGGTSGEGPGQEPSGVTRDDFEKLTSQLERLAGQIEQQGRHWQGQLDSRFARLEQARSEPEEDDYEDVLPAQAGYYQQPQMVWDPISQAWVPAQQPPLQPQQRRRRTPSRTDRRVDAIEQRQEAQELRQQERERIAALVEQRLRETGVSRDDLREQDFQNQATFEAGLSRVQMAKQRAQHEAQLAQIRAEKQTLLEQQRERGDYDQMMGGPNVPPASGNPADRLFALNARFNKGGMDLETFEKLKDDILRQM